MSAPFTASDLRDLPSKRSDLQGSAEIADCQREMPQSRAEILEEERMADGTQSQPEVERLRNVLDIVRANLVVLGQIDSIVDYKLAGSFLVTLIDKNVAPGRLPCSRCLGLGCRVCREVER